MIEPAGVNSEGFSADPVDGLLAETCSADRTVTGPDGNMSCDLNDSWCAWIIGLIGTYAI